jgi:hypothetical protein
MKPDAVEEIYSFVIDKKKNDTLYIGKNLRHDFPFPNWIWTADSKYLVFENSKAFGINATISIWNLHEKTRELEFDGWLPIQREQIHDFWDKKNKILLFFTPNKKVNSDYPSLKSIEVSAKNIETIKTFKYFFDMEYPMLKTLKEDRCIIYNGEYIDY